MIVNLYDQTTKIFTGFHTCQICPETGKVLYPRNYTEKQKELITEKNQSNFFINNKWIVKSNFKNVEVWNKKTGDKKINIEFELEKGYTEKERPDGFYKWSIDKWIVDDVTRLEFEKQNEIDKIKNEFKENELHGFFKSEILDTEIDGRVSDVINIQSICILPIEYRPTFYKNYNNEIVECEQKDFDNILIEIVKYRLSKWNEKELKLSEVK